MTSQLPWKVALLILVLFLLGCQKQPPWKLLKSGEISQVDYQQGNYSQPARTIIGFKDGSFQVLKGSYSIPATNIIIYIQDNPDGDYCVPLFPCYKIQALQSAEEDK
jgi:hypothetical protein